MAKRRIRNDATRLGIEALKFIERMQQLADVGVTEGHADHYRQYARLLREAAAVAESNADFYQKMAESGRRMK